MTKKELWLKLFSENDVALATAIHLCERFTDAESMENSKDYLDDKINDLNTEILQEELDFIFPQKQHI